MKKYNNDITMIFHCQHCGAETRITVPCKAYKDFKRGTSVKEAFPDLTCKEWAVILNKVECDDCLTNEAVDLILSEIEDNEVIAEEEFEDDVLPAVEGVSANDILALLRNIAYEDSADL